MGATQGIEASGNGRTLVVACGALARELLHVVEANGLDRARADTVRAALWLAVAEPAMAA